MTRVRGRTRPRIPWTQEIVNRVGMAGTVVDTEERLLRLELASRGVITRQPITQIDQILGGPPGPPGGPFPHNIISPSHLDTTGIPFLGAVLAYNGAAWFPKALTEAGGALVHYDAIVDSQYTGADGALVELAPGSTAQMFSTVQAAITAGDAVNGDWSIRINEGTYAEAVTIAATWGSGHDLIVVGEGVNKVILGLTTGTALTISSGSPICYFSGIRFRGGAGGTDRSVTSSGASNISAYFADCEFAREVAADFAGAGFRNCVFEEGYAVPSGMTPSSVFFESCDFGPCTWADSVSHHHFTNCVWGSAVDVIVSTGNLSVVKFTNCNFGTSGSGKKAFHINGGSQTGLAFVGCHFPAPSTADGVIHNQSTTGQNGIAVIGCDFERTTGSTNPYIKSDDAQTEGWLIEGNNFRRDGAGNYVEDSGGYSIEGVFTESVLGPNTPPCFSVNISAATNVMYYGCGDVDGAGGVTNCCSAGGGVGAETLWENQSGAGRTAGAVVVHNGDQTFGVIAAAQSLDVIGVVTDAAVIGVGSDALIQHLGYQPVVDVEGAVAIGDFLTTSTTVGAAASVGTTPTAGVFAVALTAFAGPGAGQVAAYVFPVLLAAPSDSVTEYPIWGAVEAVTWASQQDNFPITDVTVLRVTLTGSQTLTGIANGFNGRILVISNIDSVDHLTIANLSGSSSIGNRFQIGQDMVLHPQEGAIFRYDAPQLAWTCIAHYLHENVREGAMALGIAGAIPAGGTADFADFSVAGIHPGTLLRLKATVKTAVSVIKTIRLRVRTPPGAFADVAGFDVTLDPSVDGGLSGSSNPTDVAFAEGDVFQLSTVDANGASGTNLVVEAIFKES